MKTSFNTKLLHSLVVIVGISISCLIRAAAPEEPGQQPYKRHPLARYIGLGAEEIKPYVTPPVAPPPPVITPRPLTPAEKEMVNFAQEIEAQLRKHGIETSTVDPNYPVNNVWLEKIHGQEICHANRKHVDLSDCVRYAETRHECLPNVALLYKIHLMPKDQDFIPLLIDLAEFAYANKEFANLIYKAKCLPILESDPNAHAMALEKQWPKIVLYISAGKYDAQKALNMLYERYRAKEGLNRAPRFNQKVTSLIYFAQGDGDNKEKSHLHGFFEQPDMIYLKHEPKDPIQDYHLVDPGTGARL